MQELEQAMRYLEQQKQNLIQMQGSVAPSQQRQTSTPIWDEIDSITAKMSEKEFEVMAASDEFKESANAINELVKATQLSQLRPVIESSQQGKDALEKHLTLIKRLKKSAQAEVNKEMETFKEYTEKYSDMPYAEYLKMKRTKKGEKK
jgi:ABC-type transporter Mla subunit MlaD